MLQRRLVQVGVAIAAVAAATTVLRLVEAEQPVALIVLLSVVVGVSLMGRLPGVVGAVAGALSVSWFIFEPTGDLTIDQGDDVVALVAYLVVALVVGTLVTQVDEARRKERQRELEAELSRSRAAFFAAAGHNLRTPLATIQATATALQDAGDRLSAHERDELLQTIRSESDRLARLVDKVLSLSRIRSGALAPDPGPVDLGGIAQTTVARLGPLREGRHIRVAVPADLGPLRLDATMTEQVLLNLLENAVRYAPDGTEVLVSAAVLDGAVEIRVADHGPGVAPADRERIFEEYVRGDHQADVEGTGLGLAIVRALVHLQGGTVRCEDTPGGGATMVVRFPVTGSVPAPPPGPGGEDVPAEEVVP